MNYLNILLNRKKIIVVLAAGALLMLLALLLSFFYLKGVENKPSPLPEGQQVKPIGPPGAPGSQGQLDYIYNKGVRNFYASHPWYDKIPPRNEDFFIGFDSTNNSFFVELYPTTASSLSIDKQVSLLKQRVNNLLASIGVNISSYKIEWSVYPNSLPLHPDGHY